MSATQALAPARFAKVTRVARFLDVSRTKVYTMMEDGLLPYVKLGKSRRIPWEAVEKLIEENTIGQ